MERTEAHQRLLEYMRGTRAEADLRLTPDQMLPLLDQLATMGDLTRKIDPNSFSTIHYALTDKGRRDDEPPTSDPLPVEPHDLPPLSPGGAIMLELLTKGEAIRLSELAELIEKGYLTSDNLKGPNA
jgi:hypothetical protein